MAAGVRSWEWKVTVVVWCDSGYARRSEWWKWAGKMVVVDREGNDNDGCVLWQVVIIVVVNGGSGL